MRATSLFSNPLGTFKPARCFAAVAAIAALFVVQQTAQAVQIDDLTTGTTLFYSNFSGQTPVSTVPAPDASGSYYPTSAQVGTWAPNTGDPLGSSQVTSSTTAPDPGPYAPSGSANYLREYRDGGSYNGGTVLGQVASAPTAGDTVEFKVELYIPTAADQNYRTQMIMYSTINGTNPDYYSAVAWFRPSGSAGLLDSNNNPIPNTADHVTAVVGDGTGNGSNLQVLVSPLTYTPGIWQEWDLKYTAGGSTFQVGINGVFDPTLYTSSLAGGTVAGVDLSNGNNATAGSVYYAASGPPPVVPEPSSIVLLVLGGLGLVIWRRLKK